MFTSETRTTKKSILEVTIKTKDIYLENILYCCYLTNIFFDNTMQGGLASLLWSATKETNFLKKIFSWILRNWLLLLNRQTMDMMNIFAIECQTWSQPKNRTSKLKKWIFMLLAGSHSIHAKCFQCIWLHELEQKKWGQSEW